MNTGPKRQFYFSLFRLIAQLRGGDARRSESNGLESLLIGLTIYLIHYLFFAAQLLLLGLSPWLTNLLFVVLAFWIWPFWLLLLYVNSLLIKVLRLCGLCRGIAIRRAQSILWGTLTTAMACALLDESPLLHEFGAIWLVAVAMNLMAAVVLTFNNATRTPGK